jgi:hypothetical protein
MAFFLLDAENPQNAYNEYHRYRDLRAPVLFLEQLDKKHDRDEGRNRYVYPVQHRFPL